MFIKSFWAECREIKTKAIIDDQSLQVQTAQCHYGANQNTVPFHMAATERRKTLAKKSRFVFGVLPFIGGENGGRFTEFVQNQRKQELLSTQLMN